MYSTTSHLTHASHITHTIKISPGLQNARWPVERRGQGVGVIGEGTGPALCKQSLSLLPRDRDACDLEVLPLSFPFLTPLSPSPHRLPLAFPTSLSSMFLQLV